MPSPADAQIDAFVAASRALNGQETDKRKPWNTVASADAIRHFAYGTGDDNPLWLDVDYAAASVHGGRLAPPAFLASVCYPGLHGAPMEVPLTSIIGSLEYTWEKPVQEDDRLRAAARQTDVLDTEDNTGRRMVFILSEITYYRDPDEIIGRARCTMVRPYQQSDEVRQHRSVYGYTASERDEIGLHLTGYARTGNRRLRHHDIAAGQALPLRVIPPLTIGDLVGWQAAIGPSYRVGVLGYKDGLDAPQTLLTNPITGWPVRYSQGHEDIHLAGLRGMPAPFDNSVMRFAYVASILTDWMGDHGFLRRLQVHTQAPVLYGDATWYRGTIRHTHETDEGMVVSVEIVGANQLGETTTTGQADIVLSGIETSPKRVAAASEAPASLAGATVPYPDVCAHTLFEQQVAATPDATAIIFGEQRLTYRQLDERANHFAVTLRESGVRRDALIGVCAERSSAYIAMLLGILKAGGAYLPLDVSYPSGRLAALLADASADLVLVQQDFRSSIPSLYDTLQIENVWSENSAKAAPVVTGLSPANCAYVLYTSGSTGAPKGVAVSHRSLSRYLQSIRAPLGIRADDVYLHSAAFSFSASVRQMLLPLTTGATLVVADFEQRHDPQQLFRLMKAHGVTIWDTVPSFWRFCMNTLASQPDRPLPESLRLILTTGEPLTWSLVRTWRDTWGHPAEVINLYSQTETVGTVSYYRVPDVESVHTGFVPLGGPVENTNLYVLDKALKPLPREEIGELWVGGDRLADGYHHCPALTSCRFAPNPFSVESGTRLYSTGDLARLTLDDILVWAGRADRQIQIRGHRVEPAEIEAVLTAHPSVQEAAVVAYSSPGDVQALAAYIVPETTDPPTVADLRSFAGARLPLFMLPATFATLDALPRTTSGKLDRGALPAPAMTALPDEHYEAPVNPLEKALAGIWADVLHLYCVGRSDNFFELGGHSLHAVSIIAKVREQLRVRLPLRLLFDAPTVAQMADAVEEEKLTDNEVENLLGEIDHLPEAERQAVLNHLTSAP